MAPKQPPVILPSGCTPASLLPIQHLLHLTAHRNKNQHRIAKWWASFSILRRQLGKLIAALEDSDAAFRAKKIEIERRVVFLREEIVPRCYLAFSTVVADNQYASLGLMLMGCLARLNKLISFPKDEDEEADEVVNMERTTSSHVLQVEDFGEAISREELEGSVKKTVKSLKTPNKGKKGTKELLEAEAMSPLGRGGLSVSSSKKVVTDTVTSESDDAISLAPQPTPAEKKRKKVRETTVTTTSTKTTAPKPPKKKRKKGGDEFDDLFSGLI
ncbi:Ribonuclease MRP protein subunit rmp1 [Pseudogymnoascus australis]